MRSKGWLATACCADVNITPLPLSSPHGHHGITTLPPLITPLHHWSHDSYCELQLLFDAETGDAIYRSYTEDQGKEFGGAAEQEEAAAAVVRHDKALPLVLRVANWLFIRSETGDTGRRRGGNQPRFSSIAELRENLVEGTRGLYISQLSVRRMHEPVVVLPAPTGGGLGTSLGGGSVDGVVGVGVRVGSGERRPPHVVFNGDSAITALYRLGTGVNFIIAGLEDWKDALVRNGIH